MTALALALASSLCWGVSDFVCGVQSRRRSLVVVMLVSQLVGLAALGVVMVGRGAGPPDLVRLLPAFVGGLGGLAALAAFYRALAIGTMSIVAPIAATGVTVPVVVGIAGGDRPAAIQFAGLFAATVGVALASREQSPDQQKAAATRASIGLALVAAIGFGGFYVALRFSARADVWWALLASRVSGATCLIALGWFLRAPVRQVGISFVPLAVAGGLDLTANATYAIATRHGLLSVVAVAASLYPLATVALARVLLGERVRRVQEVGIAAAVLGVVLLAAG